jgi:hypothetical protein
VLEEHVAVAKPFILTPRIEEILRTVHFYRYMTALDVTYLLFSRGSLTHVRDILKVLCGGADYAPDQYLFRFPLTQFSSGKRDGTFWQVRWGLPVTGISGQRI